MSTTFKDLHLTAEFGVNAKPAAGLGAGSAHLGAKVATAQVSTSLSHAWGARLIFGAAGSATFLLGIGNITPSAAGARQVERGGILTAATTAGTYNVVVTGAGITGSPLTVPVALTAGLTGPAAARLVVAKLTATAALSAFEFWQVDTGATTADIFIRRKYPAANDATLNLNLPSTLGISGVTSSITAVAGAAGVEIEQLGGPGQDLFGEPIDTTLAILDGLLLVSHAGAPRINIGGAGYSPILHAGTFLALGNPHAAGFSEMEEDTIIEATAPAIAEIFVGCHR